MLQGTAFFVEKICKRLLDRWEFYGIMSVLRYIVHLEWKGVQNDYSGL